MSDFSFKLFFTFIKEYDPAKDLLCFRHFRKSFLLGALHRRSKLANICHDLVQNHLS